MIPLSHKFPIKVFSRQIALFFPVCLALLLAAISVIFSQIENTFLLGYYGLLNFLLIVWALLLVGWPRIVANTLLIVSFTASLVSVEVTGGMLSTGAFHSIILTNIDEIIGYFPLINWIRLTLLSISTVLISILFTRSSLVVPCIVRYTIYLAVPMLLFTYPAYRYLVDETYAEDLRQDPFSAIYIIPQMPTYNLYQVLAICLRERYLSQETYGTNIPQHILNLPDTSHSDSDIILIIGESSRSGSYSIYGESINSTPNLKKRMSTSSEFSRINGVFSPAPNTRESIARFLTFATSNTFLHEGLPFKSLLGMLSDANYDTVWITTQDLYTRWDTFSAKVANSANRVIHSSPTSEPWTDSLAAKIALEELKKPKSSFIVLHLWGEHSDYSIRNGRKLPAKSIESIKEQVVTSRKISDEEMYYLASIHHTDEIIESIFSHVEKENKNDLAIYFSDHGEVIGKGHGLLPIQLESELSIPFVSQGQRSRKLAIEINRFRDDEFGIFNTSYFPEVLINVLGGKTNVPNESRQLIYYSIRGFPTRVDHESFKVRS